MSTIDIDQLRALLSERSSPTGDADVLSEEELARWAAGELSDEERVRLLERVVASPDGIALFRATADLVASARQLEKAARDEVTATPKGLRRISAAAGRSRAALATVVPVAAVLLVASTLALWMHSQVRVHQLEHQYRQLVDERREQGSSGAGGEVEILGADLLMLHLTSSRGDNDLTPLVTMPLPPRGRGVPITVSVPAIGSDTLDLTLYDQAGEPCWTDHLRVPSQDSTLPRITLLVRLPPDVISSPQVFRLSVVLANARRYDVDIDVSGPP